MSSRGGSLCRYGSVSGKFQRVRRALLAATVRRAAGPHGTARRESNHDEDHEAINSDSSSSKKVWISRQGQTLRLPIGDPKLGGAGVSLGANGLQGEGLTWLRNRVICRDTLRAGWAAAAARAACVPLIVGTTGQVGTMDEQVSAFGHALAGAALERKWDAVHGMLAPWLQARYSVTDVQAFFESDYLRLLAGSGISELAYPAVPYVSGNPSSLESLREKKSWLPRPRPIPVEVTDANFRQWMKLQLLCSEEQAQQLDLDYLTELWLIVVEIPDGLRVGYWAHDPYECPPAA